MSDLTLEQCKNLDKWGLDLRGLGSPRHGYYKIPSLEELMEFARTLASGWYLRPVFRRWAVQLYENDKQKGAWIEDSSKQAVYKLIEKVKDES